MAALAVLWVRMRVPDSPRYLIAQGREDEARAVLDKVADDNGVDRIEARLTLPDRLGARVRSTSCARGCARSR